MSLWSRKVAVLTLLAVVSGCGSDSTDPPAEADHIVISPGALSLNQLDSLQLQATVVDASGDPIPGAHAVFSTSTPTFLSISPGGLLKADGFAGFGSVTATFDTLVLQAQVTILPVATRLEIYPGSDLTIPTSTSFKLEARVLDAADQLMTAPFTFSSDDPNVATVTTDGFLAVSGIVGNTTLTLTSDTLTAHADVHVVSMVRTPLPGQPFAAAVSVSDVAYVGTLSSNGVARIDLPATAISANVPVTAASVSFSSDGALAYVASGGLGVIPIDVAADTALPLLGFLGEPPLAVMLSDDDQTVYVGTGTGLWAVDAASGVTSHFTFTFAVNHFSRHPTLSRIYATSPDGARVLEINTSNNTISRTFNMTGQVQATGVSPDGSRLYVANELERMDVWDLVAGVETATVPVPGGPFGLTVSPDGSTLYLSVANPHDGGFVHVMDAASLTIVTTIITGGHPRAVALSQDGSVAVSANEEGWVDFLP